MNLKRFMKIAGPIASAVGVVASIVSAMASDYKISDEIEKKVSEAVAQSNKSGSIQGCFYFFFEEV